ncbi:hypothetical protein [Streptomyces sp. NBC_00557]|uniref:hypothetical protein n=1 Tax=Streptomyces sp. NBC_00557 TaxID=2975776 RepID=UPI002E803672|nr:hypothetical protein [Streptomyces sp. NBC_00557]WUC37287.1 hypothetical protein OG956_25260 [Streptomyces sp. NBC_00557]
MGALVWLLIPVVVGVGAAIWSILVQRIHRPPLGRDFARRQRMKEVLERNSVPDRR